MFFILFCFCAVRVRSFEKFSADFFSLDVLVALEKKSSIVFMFFKCTLEKRKAVNQYFSKFLLESFLWYFRDSWTTIKKAMIERTSDFTTSFFELIKTRGKISRLIQNSFLPFMGVFGTKKCVWLSNKNKIILKNKPKTKLKIFRAPSSVTLNTVLKKGFNKNVR